MARFVQTLSVVDLGRKIGRASFRRFDRVGAILVSAIRADISVPIVITTAREGSVVDGGKVRKGRGGFRGRRVIGSKPGEFPRTETGELFRSIRHRVRLRPSFASPLVLQIIAGADHATPLETKAPRDGGRKFVSRTIRRLLPRIRGIFG